RERCARVLPDLNLAGVYGDGAIPRDVQPCSDLLRHVSATPTATAAAARFLGLCRSRKNGNHDDPAAESLEESAPVQGFTKLCELVVRLFAQLVAFDLDRECHAFTPRAAI